jgi:hypothetical protein
MVERVLTALGAQLTVGDREYPVVPLVAVAVHDPATARLLDRYRRRATR